MLKTHRFEQFIDLESENKIMNKIEFKNKINVIISYNQFYEWLN